MLGLGSSITSFNVSAEPPFDLASNSDLTIWLKFDTGITDSGGVVSQWDDSSGNSNHATQTTAGNRPTTSGGKVTFDGTDDQLDFATRNDNAFTAIFAIDLNESGTLNNEVLLGNSSAGWAIKLYRATGPDDVGLRVNANTAEAGSANAHVDKQLSTGNLPSGKFLFTTTYENTSGGVTFRVDGVAAASGTFGGSTFNPFRVEQICFGVGGSGTAAALNADIYEFAYYTSVLSGTDLTDAENAIMARVGIS